MRVSLCHKYLILMRMRMLYLNFKLNRFRHVYMVRLKNVCHGRYPQNPSTERLQYTASQISFSAVITCSYILPYQTIRHELKVPLKQS